MNYFTIYKTKEKAMYSKFMYIEELTQLAGLAIEYQQKTSSI